MSQSKQIILAVQGMHCEGCVRAVDRVVKRVDPSADVSIDLAGGRVTLTTSSEAAKISAAIDAAGYQSEVLSEQTGRSA